VVGLILSILNCLLGAANGGLSDVWQPPQQGEHSGKMILILGIGVDQHWKRLSGWKVISSERGRIS
jgi:hypothetical protein